MVPHILGFRYAHVPDWKMVELLGRLLEAQIGLIVVHIDLLMS